MDREQCRSHAKRMLSTGVTLDDATDRIHSIVKAVKRRYDVREPMMNLLNAHYSDGLRLANEQLCIHITHERIAELRHKPVLDRHDIAALFALIKGFDVEREFYYRLFESMISLINDVK